MAAADPKVTAAKQQITSLQNEAKQIRDRQIRDTARLAVIQAQLDSLAPLANPPAATAPATPAAQTGAPAA